MSFLGHKEIVEILIQAGAKVDFKNRIHDTPLLLAAATGICKILLKSIGIFFEMKKISTISVGNEEIVDLLIQKGANVNHENERGDTAL